MIAEQLVVRLPCDHAFHEDCVRRWFTNQVPPCPRLRCCKDLKNTGSLALVVRSAHARHAELRCLPVMSPVRGMGWTLCRPPGPIIHFREWGGLSPHLPCTLDTTLVYLGDAQGVLADGCCGV